MDAPQLNTTNPRAVCSWAGNPLRGGRFQIVRAGGIGGATKLVLKLYKHQPAFSQIARDHF
jgi:hypothetical protein